MSHACEACGGSHDVVDVGEEQKPEWICRACILQNVEDFEGDAVNDLDLTPFEVQS